jgi:CDP-6-deoxy-D-xylo-4-hexulose-3-dehydrase
VGTYGDLGTLSFYPAHHITTGEGGAVFGRPALVKIAESFRDWGRDCWCAPGDDNTCGKRFEWQLGGLPAGYDHKYSYSHLGYNLKMTDLQAAIGNSQLAKVDDFIERRRHNHDYLTQAFKAEGLDDFFHLPVATPNSNPSWFGFALNVKDDAPWDRNQVTRFLEERRVGTRLMFGGNLVRQPAFDGVNFRTVGNLEQTDRVMNSSFWIGVWPGLDEARLDYVISAFRELARGRR